MRLLTQPVILAMVTGLAFGLVAQTSVCLSPDRTEIGGFRMTFDSLDRWTVGSDPSAFDVENVAAHEWGRVAGLEAVSAPEDRCLTMYVATSPGETEQRTL